jgi:nicotinamide riboside kinase
MPEARRIALLGAESTGKTLLSEQLAAHLQARGLRAAVAPEALREWCAREGRTPRPEEQLAIAQEQERRVDAIAATADLVLADTTALMVAIYAGMLFPDGELLRFAHAAQGRYDATLVTGLDLPWVADGLHRDASLPREDVDALVRTQLLQARVPFQVVYGSGPSRLQSALRALVSAGVLDEGLLEQPRDEGGSGNWAWMCEKCSDPECEHRLFTRLKEPPA